MTHAQITVDLGGHKRNLVFNAETFRILETNTGLNGRQFNELAQKGYLGPLFTDMLQAAAQAAGYTGDERELLEWALIDPETLILKIAAAMQRLSF